MKMAVISDIHSNSFALEAVLTDVRASAVEHTCILGDLFGYYPWALETYRLIAELDASVIKGNHDLLLSMNSPPCPMPAYWGAAQANAEALASAAPEALSWLDGLDGHQQIERGQWTITLCHGTPDDVYDGRYYPDDETEYEWFPRRDEVLLLGHTHYPLQRYVSGGGAILNPGSVGQPRDGNPQPSWGVFDTQTGTFQLRRTQYDYRAVIGLLGDMQWDAHAQAALAKTSPGALHADRPDRAMEESRGNPFRARS